MQDFSQRFSVAGTIVPQVATDVVTGATVDLLGFNGATILATIDQLAAGVTGTVRVEDSPDGINNWAAVSAGLLQGSIPALTSSVSAGVYRIGYLGGNRYIRVSVSALAGGGKAISIAAVVLKENPRTLPQ